jgi:2'-5' RNA ligase
MPQNALIVRVPEAEGYVKDLRERFDPSAGLGVPAHITVLFPFMPPEQVSESVRATIATAFAQVAPFAFALRRGGRFAATASLMPEPAEPFIALTNALVASFPQFPPYGGAHTCVVPHLTVADGDPANVDIAERELSRLLKLRGPVQSTCSSVTLLENSSGRWEELHVFELGRQP